MKSHNHFQLTLAQQDIFFDQMRQPNNPLYNIGGYVELGSIDQQRLIVAHQQLVKSQQAFGIRIGQRQSEVFQYCVDDSDESLAFVDLSNYEDSQLQAQNWLADAFAQPFEIEYSQLYQATLLKLSDDNYRYVVVAHHLMMDGWGFANLTDKLCQFYCGENVCDSADSQWTAVAGVDDAYVESSKYQKDQAFWLNQQGLAAPCLFDKAYRLQADGSKQIQSQRTVVTIHPHTFDRIKALSQQLNCSVAQFYLAVVTLYFNLLYDCESLRVGLMVHNRRKRSEKTMLGVFSGINTMVVDMPPKQDFNALVAHIIQLQKRGLRHQRFPLGHVINGLSHQGFEGLLYDLVFNYLALDTRLDFAGIDGQMVYLSHDHEPHPLKLTLWEYPHQRQAQWQIDYSLAYFAPQEAEQLAQRLDFLLHQVLDNPRLALSDYQRLLPQELNDMCQWSVPRPPTGFIHDDFERQVGLTPDAIAVSDEHHALSYRQLQQRVNWLAARLQAQGIKPDDKVGICHGRDVNLLVALLAVFKAGGAYVPLDPQYPLERLSYMLEDSEIDLVLSQSTLMPKLQQLVTEQSKSQLQVWSLDELLIQAVDFNDDVSTHAKLQPQHLAYMIYTSGSTGTPKAVQVTHSNVCAYLQWVKNRFNAAEYARVLASTSINFDISVMELFAPLSFGGEVVMVADILALVDKPHEVSLINTVPSAAKTMLEQGLLPHSVETMVLGGEALTQSLVNRLLQLPHIKQVYNLYGPTEDTVYSSFKCYRQPTHEQVVIGEMMAGGHGYVVDSKGQLQPNGLVGELYLTGLGVSRGYANNPQLTESRFIKDPFNPNNDYRVYKTGDRVRRLVSGELAYLGRDDKQVKIRGHRIEPAEIEFQLERLEGVREAVVLAYGKDNQPAQLWAFISVAFKVEDSADFVDTLNQALSLTLPTYMVPAYFRVLDDMPLTLNGKIDKKALLSQVEQQVEQLSSQNQSHSQSNVLDETARQVAEIWADLLGIEYSTIKQDDRFFALGGHSLMAVKLLGQMNEHFNIKLKLQQLFANSSLAQMTCMVKRQNSLELVNSLEQENKSPIQAQFQNHQAIALSYSQQSLWHIEQMSDAVGAYHMLAAFDVEGTLDIDGLSLSFKQIIERHQVLRTNYFWRDDNCWQQVQNTFDFKLSCVDLTDVSAQQQQTKLAQLADHQAQTQFDLTQDLMLRASWVVTGSGRGVLMVCLHHIAADGWSIGILVDELQQLYQANIQHIAHNLPALALQYGDYALWQRKWVADAVHNPQLSYWQQQLQDSPQLCSIPTDVNRKQLTQAPLKIFTQLLDESISRRIKQTSTQHDVTPFMLFHGVLALLLGRYNHSDDIVIGTGVANRMDENISDLIGYFVNLLVLRVSTDFDNFAAFMAHVRQINVDAQQHQSAPFELVLQQHQTKRSDSHSPLFQVCLTVEQPLAQAFDLGNAHLTRRAEREQQAKFDVNLVATHIDGLWQLEWQYNHGLFEPWRIEAMASHFAHMMSQLLTDMPVALNRLSLLDSKQQQLLHDFNQTDAPRQSSQTLHGLFEQQAQLHPEQIAVCYQSERISYGELNRKANQLAQLLLRRGLVHQTGDDIVAICTGRAIEAVIAVIASLKLGASYMMMDPSFPSSRLLHMWQDAKANVYLCLQSFEHYCPDVPADKSVCLDSPAVQANWFEQAADNLPSSTHLGAYVIYTSGSTGKPKGVWCRHDSTINLLLDMQDKAPLGVLDHGSLWTNLGFDVSVYELFSTLCFGATLHIVPEAIRGHKQAVLEFVVEHQITSGFLPVFVLDDLKQAVMANSSRFNLKRLLVGVEPIVLDTLLTIDKALPQLTIINGYGPSETTICCTTYVVNQADASHLAVEQNTPIGTPVANSQVLVLDQHLNLCPIGVAGELYIGGAGLGLGYLHQPQLTDARFIDHPFKAGRKLYRSGDLVRLTEHGQLQFVARVDDQIKIRGFRVEPAEIERSLKSLTAIEDAVVLPLGEGESKYLAGFVIPTDATVLDFNPEQRQLLVRKLKAELMPLLPDFMIPAQLVLLAKFPQLKNDKLDKQALKAMAIAVATNKGASIQSSQQATTATEQQLLTLWQQLLANDSIGIDQHFFELGGNSLLIAQLVHELSSQFDIQIQAKDLMAYPTIGQLANFIDGEQASMFGALSQTGLTQTGLSASQYRVWLAEQVHLGSDQNNISGGIKIQGQLSIDVVKQTLIVLTQQHAIFRCHIKMLDGEPVQKISNNEQQIKLTVEDLSNIDQVNRLDHAKRIIDAHGKSTDEQWFKLLLIKLGAFEWRLHINFHHLMFDGWSVSVFINDFIEIYQAIAADVKPPTSRTKYSYLDYVEWQRDWLQSEDAAHSRTFWSQYLAASEPQLDLPLYTTHRTSAAQTVTDSGRIELAQLVDEANWQQAQQLAAKNHCSSFVLSLSVMALMLSRLSATADVSLGVASAGRDIAGCENLLGNFVNNLPVRSLIDLSLPFEQWLVNQTDNIQQAMAHSQLPYEQIADAAHSAGRPLFEIFFNWLELPTAELDNDCFRCEYDNQPQVANKFDIVFYVKQTDQGLSVSCHFDQQKFCSDKITWLLHLYGHLFTQVCANPAYLCGDYSLDLAPSDDSKTVQPSSIEHAIEHTIEHAIEHAIEWMAPVYAQLATFGEAIAIEFDGSQLSYQQLDELSDVVAFRLQQAGVKPDDVVAIKAERNSALVVNIFGCLKVGAVFVILDKQWPQPLFNQRLAQINAKLTLDCDLIQYDSVASQFGAEKPQWAKVSADTPAYLAFTSGSSGQAKLVVGTHASLNAYIPWMAEQFGFHSQQKFAMASGLSHDPLLRDIFTPLVLGACLAIPTAAQLQPIQMAEFIYANNINVINLTPSLAAFLFDNDHQPLTSLSDVILGGEKCEPQQLQLIQSMAPNAKVASLYGTTETGRALAYVSDMQLDTLNQGCGIGQGIADVQLKVLNHKQQVCAPGEVGQIALGSRFLPLGYANDDVQTKQKFFTDVDGLRWYLTGDLGRLELDGSLSYLSRADEQLKIRGIRVEAGEIVSIVTNLSGVDNAQVRVFSLNDDKQLVLFIVTELASHVEPKSEQLNELVRQVKAELKQQMPAYLQPQMIVPLAQLPINANGKVDQRALTHVVQQQLQAQQERQLISAQNDIERQLLAWWQQLLQRRDICVTDGFFDLGGHSLLVSRLLVRIKQKFDIAPDFSTFFSHDSIRAMALVIEQRQLAMQIQQGRLPNQQPTTSGRLRKKVSI